METRPPETSAAAEAYRRLRRSRSHPQILYLASSMERHLGTGAAGTVIRRLQHHITWPAKAGVPAAGGALLLAIPAGGGAAVAALVVAVAAASLGGVTSLRRRRSIRDLQAPDTFALVGARTTARIVRAHLDSIPAAALAHPLYGETIARSVGLDVGAHEESRWLAEGFDGSMEELLDVLHRL